MVRAGGVVLSALIYVSKTSADHLIFADVQFHDVNEYNEFYRGFDSVRR